MQELLNGLRISIFYYIIGYMLANDKFIKVVNLFHKNAWTILKVSIIVFLIPYIMASFFTHAYHDDFGNAYKAKTIGDWKTVVLFYNTWSGRYSTILAVTALNPLTYNWLFGMKIVPLILLALTIFSMYLSLRAVCGGSFLKRDIFFTSLAGLSIFLYSSPEVFTSFYWLSSAIQYQLGNILFMLLLTSFIFLAGPGSNKRAKLFSRLAIISLAIILPGMNEILAVLTPAVIFIFVAASLIKRDPEFRFWTLVLVLSCICSYIAISAPGNFKRMAIYRDNMDFSVPLIDSFLWIKAVIWQSLAYNSMLILFTIIFIPISYKLAKSSRFTRQCFSMHPFLFIILFVTMLTMAAFPSYFATGGAPYPRYFNSVLFVFIIGWFIMIQLITNRMTASGFKQDDFYIPAPILSAILLFISLMLLGRAVLETSDLITNGPTYYKDVGRMYYLIKKAKADNIKDVIVPPISVCPRMLRFELPGSEANSEITPDPKNWNNTACAQYFGLNSIRTEPSAPRGTSPNILSE